MMLGGSRFHVETWPVLMSTDIWAGDLEGRQRVLQAAGRVETVGAAKATPAGGGRSRQVSSGILQCVRCCQMPSEIRGFVWSDSGRLGVRAVQSTPASVGIAPSEEVAVGGFAVRAY